MISSPLGPSSHNSVLCKEKNRFPTRLDNDYGDSDLSHPLIPIFCNSPELQCTALLQAYTQEVSPEWCCCRFPQATGWSGPHCGTPRGPAWLALGDISTDKRTQDLKVHLIRHPFSHRSQPPCIQEAQKQDVKARSSPTV